MRSSGRSHRASESLAFGPFHPPRAVFFPKGLSGRLYWWAIFPFHGIIFSGMANRITAEAEAEAASTSHEQEVTKR